MDILLEDPAPIWIAGALGATTAGVAYAQTRTAVAAAAVVLVVVITAAMLVAEAAYQTPREQVESALEGLLEAVRANDLPGVLVRLAPGPSEVRSDAEEMMPRFLIEKVATIGVVEVTLLPPEAPTSAHAGAKVFVKATHHTTGMGGGKVAEVAFSFIKAGDRWLLSEYSPGGGWRRGAAELSRGP